MRRKERPNSADLEVLYIKSGSIRELSRRLGIKNITARRWLIDAKITIVPRSGGLAPGRKLRFRIPEIELACIQAGLSRAEILLIVNHLRGYSVL